MWFCFADSRFQGTMLTTASFICQDILPTGTLRSDKYGTNNWWRPLKNEDGTDFRHLSGVPISNGHHQSRSLFSSFNERQFPFLHENGTTSSTGSILFENNQYPPPPAISGPQSLFQDTSLRSEDFNVYDTTSTTIQGLSGVSDSGCALSLLSSQSQNSSSHSSGIPMAARPLVIPSSSHSNYSQSQLTEKIVGMSSHASSTNAGVSDRFRSEMNPASNGGSHLNPVLISDNSNILNFDMADGMFQGPGFVNMKDGPTIDLLQLSSQLQRVEHQRQSSQAKQENDSTL